MEFLDPLYLIHLQKHLSFDTDSIWHHTKQSQHTNEYYSHHILNIKHPNQQENCHLHNSLSRNKENSYTSEANNTLLRNLFSSVPMPAFSSEFYNNEASTGGNLTTEQAVIVEATNKNLSGPLQSAIDEFPLRLPTWGIVIIVIGYLLVFIFGIFGNCCVLFVVVRLRRMKTVTNYFIFNLAISDGLILLFCLLPNLISNIFVPWVLGWLLCKVVPYIQGLAVCSSVYFLVAISVERCIAIQWPFKYQITKDRAKLVIIGIWLWAGIVALPWALFFQAGHFDPDNPHLEFCIEVWPENYQDWSTYYFLFGNLFICYLFPLGVIFVCYVTIWFRVYRRSVPSNCYQRAMELIHQRSKTAVIKMLVVVVLIFALSWLPLYAIIIRIKFGQEPGETESFVISLAYPVAQWLGCFNSCINPIVYSFLNLKFRRAFMTIFGINRRKNKIIKHKSPTVNILLKRFSTINYRVETTMSNNDGSSESI